MLYFNFSPGREEDLRILELAMITSMFRLYQLIVSMMMTTTMRVDWMKTEGRSAEGSLLGGG